jgi:hypothetical protein
MNNHPEVVTATSGGMVETFVLDWQHGRWTSEVAYEMSDYPFIAEIGGKRYELYGDGTFDEEELAGNS